MENKKAIPGQTVYLKPGEKFESIQSLAEREAEMLKSMPAPIRVNGNGEIITEEEYQKLMKLSN